MNTSKIKKEEPKKEEPKKEESKKTKSKNKIRIRPRFDKIKSRIPIPSEVRDMNERIKKKKESGKKDIFDYIGDIIKTPYRIRGGKASGGKASKMPVARDKNKPSAHSMDKKAVMLKSGGRTGYSVGGRAMRGVSKILMKK